MAITTGSFFRRGAQLLGAVLSQRLQQVVARRTGIVFDDHERLVDQL